MKQNLTIFFSKKTLIMKWIFITSLFPLKWILIWDKIYMSNFSWINFAHTSKNTAMCSGDSCSRTRWCWMGAHGSLHSRRSAPSNAWIDFWSLSGVCLLGARHQNSVIEYCDHHSAPLPFSVNAVHDDLAHVAARSASFKCVAFA